MNLKSYNLSKKKSNTYANRGMTLEEDVNLTNEYYIAADIALIHKKPTPIGINKVNYQKMQITDAYFLQSSTLDYNGIYKGKYIDFDAKETRSKTSFPLANIHTHQLKHLESVIKHGGISFLIIRFTSLNKTYLLLSKVLLNFIKNEDRKSIPISFFEKNAYKVETKYSPRLDYLKIINEIIK